MRSIALTSVVVAALAACRDRDREPPPMPAPVRELGCGHAGNQLYAIQRLWKPFYADMKRRAGLGNDALLAMFAEDYAPVRALIEKAGAAYTTIGLVSGCPTSSSYLLGDGLVTDVQIVPRSFDELSTDRDDWFLHASFAQGRIHHPDAITLHGAYVHPGADGWIIDATVPRTAYGGMRVDDTRAEVWVSVARRWLRADVELDVQAYQGTLVLEVPFFERMTEQGPTAGFRVVSLSVDGDELPPRPRRSNLGADGRELLGPDGNLVLVDLPAGTSTVRIVYEGWFPPGGDVTDGREAHLVDWLPRPPVDRPHPRRVTLHHPDDEHVITPVRSRWVESPWRGWTALDMSDTGANDFVVVAARGAPVATRVVAEGAGGRLELVQFAEPAAHCAAAIGAAADAVAPLGRLGQVQIGPVSLHGINRQSAGLALVNDSLLDVLCGEGGAAMPLVRDPKRLDEAARSKHGRDLELADLVAEARGVVAHELAHVAFGTAVTWVGDEAARWWEATAEYASLWARPGSLARDRRRKHAADYAALGDADVVGMSQRVRIDKARSDRLSYAKGALLLTAVEDRIGKDRLIAALQRFIADNRGKPGSWPALVAAVRAVAGDAEADWFAEWLRRPGAPDLRLVDVRVDGDRLHGALLQSAPPFTGRVELVIQRGDDVLARHQVDFAGERTAIDLPLPAEADTVYLDPDARLPRKFDPAADHEMAGLKVRITRTASRW